MEGEREREVLVNGSDEEKRQISFERKTSRLPISEERSNEKQKSETNLFFFSSFFFFFFFVRMSKGDESPRHSNRRSRLLGQFLEAEEEKEIGLPVSNASIEGGR